MQLSFVFNLLLDLYFDDFFFLLNYIFPQPLDAKITGKFPYLFASVFVAAQAVVLE